MRHKVGHRKLQRTSSHRAALLRILNTFAGSYQMLPSPRLDLGGDDHKKLFEAAAWGTLPVHQALLDVAAPRECCKHGSGKRSPGDSPSAHRSGPWRGSWPGPRRRLVVRSAGTADVEPIAPATRMPTRGSGRGAPSRVGWPRIGDCVAS